MELTTHAYGPEEKLLAALEELQAALSLSWRRLMKLEEMSSKEGVDVQQSTQVLIGDMTTLIRSLEQKIGPRLFESKS